MATVLLWLWDRTEPTRLRIDLWACRVRIRRDQAEYDDPATHPAVRAKLFRLLASRRAEHAALLRTLFTLKSRTEKPTE